MRRLVGVVAFLWVLALAPAAAAAQPRWTGDSASPVTVYLERTSVGATIWAHVRSAGYE